MNKMYDKMFLKNENQIKYKQLVGILMSAHKADKDIKHINDVVTKGNIKI